LNQQPIKKWLLKRFSTFDQMRANIVVILPRGETYRNFVYTRALDTLATRAELTILSVIPNEEFQQMLSNRFGRAFTLKGHRGKWCVRILREVVDMSHGRRLWSGAARERWRLRDAEANTPVRWLKRQSKKFACYPFANETGLKLLSKVERAASKWFSAAEEYVRLYGELRPSLVFNSSHAHSEIATPAVEAAQWLGIPTATFIFSWDNLTSQGRILLPYDYFLVWNENLRSQLLRIYPDINPECVFVTGTPQFDTHFKSEFYWSREEFCARVGADPSRPIVFYSTGMANHVPGEPRIVENIAAMLREIPVSPPPQLLVRVSPKDRTGRFKELKCKAKDILFPDIPWEASWLTPKIDDAYLLVNSLRHAAVGVNVGSTVSLELCMFDKPVINVGYNPFGIDVGPVDISRYYDFDHYRPIVESGAVRLAHSEDEMRELLTDVLSGRDADSDNRRKLISSMFSNTLDGNSGQRVVECLLNIVNQQTCSI
jgi:hypothetical protein